MPLQSSKGSCQVVLQINIHIGNIFEPSPSFAQTGEKTIIKYCYLMFLFAYTAAIGALAIIGDSTPLKKPLIYIDVSN
jgi:hypothetical protein